MYFVRNTNNSFDRDINYYCLVQSVHCLNIDLQNNDSHYRRCTILVIYLLTNVTNSQCHYERREGNIMGN